MKRICGRTSSIPGSRGRVSLCDACQTDVARWWIFDPTARRWRLLCQDCRGDGRAFGFQFPITAPLARMRHELEQWLLLATRRPRPAGQVLECLDALTALAGDGF